MLGIYTICYYLPHLSLLLFLSLSISLSVSSSPSCSLLQHLEIRCNYFYLGLLLLLSSDRADMWPVLWQLMCAYILLAFLGFCLILLFLDRIGAQADPESTGIQVGFSFV